MSITKISDKYQVVIPKTNREKLNLKQGQKLMVYTIGSHLIMSPKHKNYADRLEGLGKETWKNIDPLKYIIEERKSWDKKTH